MSRQQRGKYLDEADTEAGAWSLARHYTSLLRQAGVAGKWTVRPEKNAPSSREAYGGRTGGAQWRVVLYDERGPEDQSVASLLGLLKLARHGHASGGA